jgi:hypothetical protein
MEDDLYREGHAVRIHEVIHQRSRSKSGDLEQPLCDWHLARFESRELEPRLTVAVAAAAG